MKNMLLYAIIGLLLIVGGQGAYISVLKNKISSITSEYNEKLAKKEVAWQKAVYDTTYDIVLKRRLREPSPEMMEEQEPDFFRRMLNFCCEKRDEQTEW